MGSFITIGRAEKIASDLEGLGRTVEAEEIRNKITDSLVRYSTETVDLKFVELPGHLAFPFQSSQ